jgi:hypothetical protein
MSAGIGIIARRKATARSKVTNHHDLLPGVDGRSPAARRFRDILANLASDQGGIERISEARLQLIRRFSAAAVLAEGLEARLLNGEAIEVSEHARLSSTLVRLVERIGIDRHSKDITPSLTDYLQKRGTAEPQPADTDVIDAELAE